MFIFVLILLPLRPGAFIPLAMETFFISIESNVQSMEKT
jgi:hypothetical protein